jgi:hypothetical protein
MDHHLNSRPLPSAKRTCANCRLLRECRLTGIPEAQKSRPLPALTHDICTEYLLLRG